MGKWNYMHFVVLCATLFLNGIQTKQTNNTKKNVADLYVVSLRVHTLTRVLCDVVHSDGKNNREQFTDFTHISLVGFCVALSFSQFNPHFISNVTICCDKAHSFIHLDQFICLHQKIYYFPQEIDSHTF